MELAVEGFQVITNPAHRSIIPQISPVVKRVPGDFHSVRFVCFDTTQRIAAIFLDEQWVDSADKETGLMHHIGYRFVVTPGVFQNHPGFAVNGFNCWTKLERPPAV